MTTDIMRCPYCLLEREFQPEFRPQIQPELKPEFRPMSVLLTPLYICRQCFHIAYPQEAEPEFTCLCHKCCALNFPATLN